MEDLRSVSDVMDNIGEILETYKSEFDKVGLDTNKSSQQHIKSCDDLYQSIEENLFKLSPLRQKIRQVIEGAKVSDSIMSPKQSQQDVVSVKSVEESAFRSERIKENLRLDQERKRNTTQLHSPKLSQSDVVSIKSIEEKLFQTDRIRQKYKLMTDGGGASDAIQGPKLQQIEAT
jgi:hypothetical protein